LEKKICPRGLTRIFLVVVSEVEAQVVVVGDVGEEEDEVEVNELIALLLDYLFFATMLVVKVGIKLIVWCAEAKVRRHGCSTLVGL
jgi:hypothetical protein